MMWINAYLFIVVVFMYIAYVNINKNDLIKELQDSRKYKKSKMFDTAVMVSIVLVVLLWPITIVITVITLFTKDK